MITDREFVREKLPRRDVNTNKYRVGTLLCVCGSYKMAGAAVLAARSALRMGAGLVRCVVPEDIYPIVSSAVPEAVFELITYNESGSVDNGCISRIIKLANKSDAVLLGCGLGLHSDMQRLVLSLLYHAEVPLIVDADGINCISKHINVLKDRSFPTILTPHEGEMSRLSGFDSEYIRNHREDVSVEFSRENSAVVVLKGNDTVIACADRAPVHNPTGNPGMAVAGSGDVLAGMIASLVAQGADCFDAAIIGTFLHGLAGDIAASELTEYSMLPSDIIERIPRAIKECI